MNSKKLHMDELHQIHQAGLKPDELIIDVREADDYADGHVPGSRSIPHDQILAAPEKFRDELKAYKTVYIHCGGGGKAGRVTAALEAVGATNIVHVCDSGMRSWIAAGHPVQK
ncbi:MAG: rhodanese-like domain-containing protein [Bdellovibrionia bacterium]